ncbi:MAG: response regulator [Magnetococcales bacterium]|nr:response regulator [Magnetococcales bacterium]
MTSDKDKARILIVDDQPSNIKVLIACLGTGYKTSIATNGLQALEVARKISPDLILLDIMMPEMDGFEVCRRLKESHKTKNIPVIFITAMQGEIDEAKGFELGAVDYITKPIKPSIVHTRVQTQLKIRSLHCSLEQSNLFIRKTFGRYMSDEVAATILDKPEGLKLGGESKFVTVMMTDLRGFTTICEGLSPEQVIIMLNIYLEVMTGIIIKYNGTIIELLGDGILVVFGAPTSSEDDAQRAVACALEMQLAIPDVNARNLEHGFPMVAMGCGINSGQVVVGNIGSDQRSKYGVVGKVINLAGRIESFSVGGQILISNDTVQACAVPLRIDDQWSVRAKGVPSPITVYQIGGIEGKYDIQLPKPQNVVLNTIKNGPKLRMSVLEGKLAKKQSYRGQVVALLPPIAEISTSLQADKMTNLQIELFDENEIKITDQLYGKVVGFGDSNDSLKIHFTSVPKAAEQAFSRLLSSESK